jgi:ABC-type nickel/cobalt efflux system permease component RcnA
MAQHKHKHKHSDAHVHERGNESTAGSNKFHKDWRVWLMVGLMLAAMFTYVLTLDDSVVPSIMRQ